MKYRIIVPIIFILGLLGLYVLLDADHEGPVGNVPAQSVPQMNYDFKKP